jgi:hypothetical protein
MHFIHDWRIEKRAGNFEYRECKVCSKRSTKIISNLPAPFGGIIQDQWLEGKPLLTMDDKAVMYPNSLPIRNYMWNKNKFKEELICQKDHH